jgi:hypothetical protein
VLRHTCRHPLTRGSTTWLRSTQLQAPTSGHPHCSCAAAWSYPVPPPSGPLGGYARADYGRAQGWCLQEGGGLSRCVGVVCMVCPDAGVCQQLVPPAPTQPAAEMPLVNSYRSVQVPRSHQQHPLLVEQVFLAVTPTVFPSLHPWGSGGTPGVLWGRAGLWRHAQRPTAV